MEQTTIKIKGQELILRQSFKALIKFEEISGKNAFQVNATLGDSITVFYCMLTAVNPLFNISFDEFIALLDESPELLTSFNNFMLSLVQVEKAVKDNRNIEIRGKKLQGKKKA